MHRSDNHLCLSATDLANHLACRHLTGLNQAAAEGRIEAPVRDDPRLDALIERGLGHERAYVEHLRAGGRRVLELPGDLGRDEALGRTLEAMRSGVDVIVQAALGRGRWYGRADVLLRVDRPGALGGFSYEVVDTKLTRETRAGTILQLCVYTDVLSEIQGTPAEHMHVVVPGVGFVAETYRTGDFLAYYRLVRSRLEAAVGGGTSEAYPEPVVHCDVCRWWARCRDRRRGDDHLSLVAGISRLQRGEFASHGLTTLAALGDASVPFGWRPARGAPEGFVRVREQARIQLEGRRSGRNLYELLAAVDPGLGLGRLPEPSGGDVFFDFEGDPFVAADSPSGEGGLEYLWGWVERSGGEWRYEHLWALDREGERRAFTSFVGQMIDRWERHPDFHIYHYAPYEPSALKRLMGRYATSEDQIDRMLHAGLFVDLYAVVRQGIRASVERYSIKDLEVFFGYVRTMDLRRASAAQRRVEVALELGKSQDLDAGALEAVRVYNADDCYAAAGLRDWLERLRKEAIAAGHDVPRPRAPEPKEEKPDDWGRTIAPVLDALLASRGEDGTSRTAAEHARWALAHLLDFYRREAKAPWWNYFRLVELSDAELEDESAAVAHLEFVGRVGGKESHPVDRYAFPAQDTNVREGDPVRMSDGTMFGSVDAMDLGARTVDVKKAGAVADVHPTSIFTHRVIGAEVKAEALLRIARWVVAHGVEGTGLFEAGRQLLLREPPRFTDKTRLPIESDDLTSTAAELGLKLDGTTLAIQGPPGSGKTYTAAEMAVALLKAGRRVGVAAGSHKVIRHLIDWILTRADAHHQTVQAIHKVSKKREPDASRVLETTANQTVVRAIASGAVNVIGGTSWLWAREAMAGSVDVLFVDEAGQVSLADAVAMSQGARSLVLLGDPCQLEQPQQGSHPEGTGLSALDHLLDGQRTIPSDRGLFLAKTRRLAPAIAEFTSELFYEGRLGWLDGLERQVLEGDGPIAGAGLWFAPTRHSGNQSASPEEVRKIETLWRQLTRGETRWVDSAGERRVLGPEDILIVAPYNAQVSDLKRALPDARVGTVDRFQGQEAAVVIYSMTTSSQDEAPHGMEFLYSLNRLNVATSRAMCASILVANPEVFEPECRTPAEMRLANAFCRYVELATVL